MVTRRTGPAAATTLALWCAAWQGGASVDTVLGVLHEIGLRAGVRAATTESARRSGLPGPGEASAGSAELLPVLARGGAAALVTPVPGDLRGMPPRGAVVGPALQAGAVVVLPDAGLGLVPLSGLWQVFECEGEHPALSVAEAIRVVDAAVSEATRLLRRADVAHDRGHPRGALRLAAEAQEVITPPGLESAVLVLLERAALLAAMLTVAAGHDTAAVTARQVQLVDAALAPLQVAVRQARRTAVAAGVASLRGSTASTTS